MKKPKYTPEEQKQILEAHKLCENGVKLGLHKSKKTGVSETPLFGSNNQTSLF